MKHLLVHQYDVRDFFKKEYSTIERILVLAGNNHKENINSVAKHLYCGIFPALYLEYYLLSSETTLHTGTYVNI